MGFVTVGNQDNRGSGTRSLEGQKGRPPRCRRHGCSETCASLEMVAANGGTYTERLSTVRPRSCKYSPNIDPTSSSAHPVDIVRIFRMAEEPAPALVATPHEAQKTVLDQTLRSKEAGVNIARDFTHRYQQCISIGIGAARPQPHSHQTRFARQLTQL